MTDTGQPVQHERDCVTCERLEGLENECPRSQQPCGHHCNHSWTNDFCCWCREEFNDGTEP